MINIDDKGQRKVIISRDHKTTKCQRIKRIVWNQIIFFLSENSTFVMRQGWNGTFIMKQRWEGNDYYRRKGQWMIHLHIFALLYLSLYIDLQEFRIWDMYRNSQ